MPKNRKLRVCAYCRVSTDMDEQAGSYENQVELYTEKIQSKSLVAHFISSSA